MVASCLLIVYLRFLLNWWSFILLLVLKWLFLIITERSSPATSGVQQNVYHGQLHTNSHLEVKDKMMLKCKSSVEYVHNKYMYKLCHAVNDDNYDILQHTFKEPYNKRWPEYLKLKQQTCNLDMNLCSQGAPCLQVPLENNTFQDNASKLFNNLPIFIRNWNNFSIFSKLVKQYLANRDN